MSLNLQFSYWEHQSFLKDIDVAIIGCGIVGLNAAIKLKELEPQRHVVIIERGALPSGASTKNAGFACFGSVSEILEDMKIMGEDNCYKLISNRWNGLKVLRERVGDENMDFQCLGGYEVFREEDKDLFETCKLAIPNLNKKLKELLGLDDVYELADSKLDEFKMAGFKYGIWNKWEGQLDPGKMIKTLISKAKDLGVEFLNGMNILSIEDLGSEGVKLQTDISDSFMVNKLIVATNGFAKRLLPQLEVKPARNQVIVTEPIKDLAFKGCFHFDHGYFYWRNIHDRILLGGGRNLFMDKEYTDDINTTDEVIRMLKKFLNDYILPGKNPEISVSWAGILGLGPVKSPIIKQVSENIIVSVRMGGMGVALGSLAGEQAVAELLKNT